MDLGDASLQPISVLGAGTFGRVFLCLQREGRQKRKVCVKRIFVKNPKSELALIKEEIYIMSQLRHPHIVQFIRSFEHAGTVNIVLEYAPNGTIRNVIQGIERSGLEETKLLRYFSDMVLGLEYLHIRHVIHRDIKPENMLLDAAGRVKYADFGISNVHAPAKQQKQCNMLGTPLYMPPEILLGGKVDFKADLWSLGLVLYELCVGRHPFATLLSHDANCEQLHAVLERMTRPKLDCQLVRRRQDPVWARLCEAMVVYDQEQRVCLPDIMRMDALTTLHIYQQYFNYDY
ncbi:png [Drosophila busckii]|uniref:Png n=1 Tax=Drosophila busckii TaxID=30019 RepID=A0A0M5J662_DROBS|nr:aurora kinase A [Drosophila busckii]ALC49156.1 png [Drosophila busckii]